jgi:hypothetical protein
VTLSEVVHQLGLELRIPNDAEPLPVIVGSRVAVDIRAGTDFVPAQCRAFYQRLLTTRGPPYSGALAVINAGSEAPAMRGMQALEDHFKGQLAVVAWRIGDNPEPLEDGVSRLTKLAEAERPGEQEPPPTVDLG